MKLEDIHVSFRDVLGQTNIEEIYNRKNLRAELRRHA